MLQKIMDAISEAGRDERSHYHVTLGQLIKILEVANSAAIVQFDDGSYPGKGMSYRGYYSDLSFNSKDEPKTVDEFLRECRALLGSVLVGYKGGDFTMTENTPLWRAPHGNIGEAIVSYVASPEKIVLILKDIDPS